MKKRFSIYLPENTRNKNVLRRIERIAKKRNRSINYVINEALSEYVEEREPVEKGD